jgi:F-type H+-transporting ATPase subunit delta
MAVAASAKRYAQAVFQLAEAQDSFDRWQEGLDALAGVAGDPGFRVLMESPRISPDEKARLLREQLPGADVLLVQLVQLLISKRRVDSIPGLVETYREMLDARRGVVHVRVTTATRLSESERTALETQVAERLSKVVHLTANVDPDILGGAVLRVGDKLVDGSLRSRLSALRRQMTAG